MTDRAGPRARLVLAACAVLALTSLHHVYGAIHYATPWRYHAVQLSGVTLLVILGAYRLGRTKAGTTAGRAADRVLRTVSWLVPVLLIGGFEGLYNHVVKNALYWGGLPAAWMTSLFPPPTYEMPNDLLFEVTGILQVLPAALTARELAHLAPDRVVGLLDLVNAFYQGLSHDVQLGAAYYIPTFIVPALVVTHVMMFRMLIRHPR